MMDCPTHKKVRFFEVSGCKRLKPEGFWLRPLFLFFSTNESMMVSTKKNGDFSSFDSADWWWFNHHKISPPRTILATNTSFSFFLHIKIYDGHSRPVWTSKMANGVPNRPSRPTVSVDGTRNLHRKVGVHTSAISKDDPFRHIQTKVSYVSLLVKIIAIERGFFKFKVYY